jgi:hypothetical protein
MFTETSLSYQFSCPEFARSVVDSIVQDNLLDVQGHAIRGIENLKEYVEDARRSGDHELVEYFERVNTAYLQAANEAAELLLGRLAMPDQN